MTQEIKMSIEHFLSPANAERFYSIAWMDALKKAVAHAGLFDGIVANAPQILYAKGLAGKESPLLHNWFTPLGEELIIEFSNGKKAQLNIHGPGFATEIERIRLGRFPKIVCDGAVRLAEDEKYSFVEYSQVPPNRRKINTYWLEELAKFKSIPNSNNYAILTRLDDIRKSEEAPKARDIFTNPRYLAKVGDMTVAYHNAKRLVERFGPNTAINLNYRPAGIGKEEEPGISRLVYLGADVENYMGLAGREGNFLAVSENESCRAQAKERD